MEDDKYADRIRKIIAHENELENNRLQWMLVIQGFLLAGLGASIKSCLITRISIIFAIIGFVTSFSVFIHLIHCRMAMQKTLNDFEEKFANYKGPKVIGLNMSKLKWYHLGFLIPPYVLPPLFMIVWIVLPICLSIWK